MAFSSALLFFFPDEVQLFRELTLLSLSLTLDFF